MTSQLRSTVLRIRSTSNSGLVMPDGRAIAVGYARISKDDALEGRGVARQSEDIAAVCARNDWDLQEVLIDNDISASRYTTKPRPGYEKLLQLIVDRSINRAVVYDLDRLLRIPRQLEDLIDLVEKFPGVEIHTVTGHIDLTSSTGRYMARTIVNHAAMDSDNASRRLRRAFEQKAREGKPHGPRPFGYEADGVTPQDEEAKLIQEAAADILSGMSLNAIARRWNDLGVLTPQRAREWSGTVVKAVLVNPRQAGMRHHRGELTKADAWPANLDRRTHERLVAHFSRPAGKRPALRTNPFGGLVTDPYGVPLDRDVVRGRPAYRGRRRPGREAQMLSISAEPLERWLLHSIEHIVDGDALAASMKHRRVQEKELPNLAELEGELEQLAEDLGEGRISRVEWLAARDPLFRRLEEAQRASTIEPPRLAETATYEGLLSRWHDIEIRRQRQLLKAVLKGVKIHPAARRGGPQPQVPGIGRIDLDRVEVEWQV